MFTIVFLAYDMFFGIIDPNYVLRLDGNWIDDCNAQGKMMM